jgi:ketosteroid isomerase-like protein
MTGTERVRAYYASLNTGDAAAVSSHFTVDAQWYIENLIEQGDQVAIEWSGAKRLDRGGATKAESA